MSRNGWSDEKTELLKMLWEKYLSGKITENGLEKTFMCKMQAIKLHAKELNLPRKKDTTINYDHLAELLGHPIKFDSVEDLSNQLDQL